MRLVLPGIRDWRHDLGHCLHTTMGVLLAQRGLDPLEVLGAAWSFWYRPGDVRREEYYFPGGAESLLSALAPYHPVRSVWHAPPDAATGWTQVRDALLAGQPVAVAADNFHLPFRPAYRDVHTNHLLTVFGFDEERDEVLVADPVPPRFTGPIRLGELAAARGSANPIRHDRDMFFTENPIGHRWLEIAVTGPVPPCDADFVADVIRRNLDGFRAGTPDTDPEYRGLAGLRRHLADVARALAEVGEPAIDEAFVVAGAVLAATGVHADWLDLAGRRFAEPRLREAARAVDRVAHHWSALRITLASARADPPAAAPAVRCRADALLTDQEYALDLLDAAVPSVAR